MADKLSQTGVLLLVSFVAMSYSHPVNAAALSAGQILKNVQRSSSPPYETAKLKMTIEESDGSKKERELTLVRRNGKDARALIRLLKPSDLEGLTLLTISKGKEEDQWLYLPSEKKKRRILGSNKKGKFLDSEIAYEDLRASTYKDYKNKILKQGPQQIVVESLAKPKSDATYGRVLTVISLPNYTIHNVEYFDHEGELLKKAEFKDYQPMGKGYWRAQKVLVHNVQDNRRTTMTATQISLNKVKESEVSINALED